MGACGHHYEITGGDQEFLKGRHRKPIGIIALQKAVELLNYELPAAALRMEQLRDRFEMELKERSLTFKSMARSRVVNTASFLSWIDGEANAHEADLCGIAASHGSACSSGALEPSHVLRNMGLSRARFLRCPLFFKPHDHRRGDRSGNSNDCLYCGSIKRQFQQVCDRI